MVVQSRNWGEGSRSISQYLNDGTNAVHQGDEGDHGGRWEDGKMEGNQSAGDAGDAEGAEDAGDAREDKEGYNRYPRLTSSISWISCNV